MHFMRLALIRRISAALLSLTLVMGPAMYAIHAPALSTKMAVAASSDMHLPGKCDDCGGNKAGMPIGTCSMACNGMIAVSPDVPVLDALLVETHGHVAARGMTGLVAPPDPYPPRPTVLS